MRSGARLRAWPAARVAYVARDGGYNHNMSVADEVRRELRQAGFANSVIDVVWPEWWSSDAEQSLSATTELRYTVARRLGLSPQSLFEGTPRFVWRDHARYKNVGTQNVDELAALSSFGAAVARTVTAATAGTRARPRIPSALDLRRLLLQGSTYVNLPNLLVLCWSMGIPVIHLEVLPLEQKRMHAMSVRVQDNFALLLARRSPYAAQVAYTIAHELGHIALRHLDDAPVLVEADDPLGVDDRDEQESGADRYALELLTGSPQPTIVADVEHYSASQLADAVLRQAPEYLIEPGVLALCAGHSSGRWKQTFSALNLIPPGKDDVASEVNRVAAGQVNWSSLPQGSAWYLRQVMGLS